MLVWIPVSLAATCLQTSRNVYSKRLSNVLKPLTVSWTRFACGLPIVLIAYLILCMFGFSSGVLNSSTILLVFASALLQILGNTILIYTFRLQTFFVAIVLYKLQSFFAFFYEVVFGSDVHSLWAWLGVLCGGIGALAITLSKRPEKISYDHRQLFGIVASAVIAGSALTTRAGIRSVEGGSLIASATYYLILVLAVQALVLSMLILLASPGELRRLIEHRGDSIKTGVVSALGSIGWFWSFSLAPVSYVKTVSNIEVILSAAASKKLFKESIAKSHVVGASLIVCGIVFLTLG